MKFVDYLNRVSSEKITFIRPFELETYKEWIAYVPDWWNIDKLLSTPAELLSIDDLQKVLRFKQDKQLISEGDNIDCYRASISMDSLVDIKMSGEEKSYVAEELQRFLNLNFEEFQELFAELKRKQNSNPDRIGIYLLYVLDDVDFEVARQRLEARLALLREKNVMMLRRSTKGVF